MLAALICVHATVPLESTASVGCHRSQQPSCSALFPCLPSSPSPVSTDFLLAQILDEVLRKQYPHVTRWLETLYRHPAFVQSLQVSLHPPERAVRFVPNASNPWGEGPHPLAQLLQHSNLGQAWTGMVPFLPLCVYGLSLQRMRMHTHAELLKLHRRAANVYA